MTDFAKGLLWLGLGLASLGFGLSVVCALGYLFLYVFRFFAVTWSELKSKNETEQWFWLCENTASCSLSFVREGEKPGFYVMVFYRESEQTDYVSRKEFTDEDLSNALSKAINFINDNDYSIKNFNPVNLPQNDFINW